MAWIPAVIRMACDEFFILEQQYEQGADDESADMGPECRAAALCADRTDTADKLQQQPVTEHEYGRHRDGREEKAEKDEHMYADSWVEHDVGAHDAADRAGCANNGRGGFGI